MCDNEFAAAVAEHLLRALEPRLQRLEASQGVAPEYLTLRAAARLTSFSYDYLYNAVSRGELPAVKKGRDWRVPLAALRDWMDKDRGGSGAPVRSQMSRLVKAHLPGLSG